MTERISESTKPQASTFHPSPPEVEKEENSTPPSNTQKLSSYQPIPTVNLTLPSLEQRKDRFWNTDVTGQTGYKWDIPGLQATNLQSENRVLNEVYRGINNTVGLGAGVVNYANNVAGAVLIDLPAKAEEISVKHGGPDFAELTVSAQTATPGMAFDDILFLGLRKITQFSKQAGVTNKAPSVLLIAEKRKLRLSDHTLQRMAERGVQLEEIKNVVNSTKPFKYSHDGFVKMGYYDSATKIFIGEASGTVTTVIKNVKPNYIENLKRSQP